jgi:hypothetical protein
MKQTIYKVQTCNWGNPEVIKVVNGIAKEIVSRTPLTMQGAKDLARDLNRLAQG